MSATGTTTVRSRRTQPRYTLTGQRPASVIAPSRKRRLSTRTNQKLRQITAIHRLYIAASPAVSMPSASPTCAGDGVGS